MPRYGHCSQCGQSVWLNESGACPQGHGPECISGVTEAPAAQAPVPAVPQKKGPNTLLIVLLVVLGIPAVLFVIGIIAAIAIPVFNFGASDARAKACFANERVMEGAYQMWLAEDTANAAEAVPDYATLADVTRSYVSSPVTCTEGGEYSFDSSDGLVTCSKHGHYPEAE